MSIDTERIAAEISDTLAATKENCTVKAVDLGDYGTSCEITKHGSDKKLHITPVEDGLLDLVLYDETGATIATGTLFDKAVTDITPEELSNLVTICL